MSGAESARVSPNRVEFLTVGLGGRRYAIETGHVESVGECPPVTRVPRAPDVVEGVASLDGEVVAVIDIAAELGADEVGSDFLRFERAGRPVGIRIRRAHGVERYPVEALSALDGTTARLFDADPRWFKAVLETDGERLPVLDRDRIVAAARSR